MLVQCMLWSCVIWSVTIQSSIETAECIELVFGIEATLS